MESRTLYFLDTNILLYSISRDPAEIAKRQRAVELLDSAEAASSVQVLQEFYVQATRWNRPDAIPHEIAASLIQTWTRFKIQEIDLRILAAALEIRATYGFSYWDSAIVAAARALGCRELYTEDLSHGQRVDGVEIVNPFR